MSLLLGAVPKATVGPSRQKPLPAKVLVAEDEHLVAAGLCAQLSTLGCSIVGPAADGRAALQAAELDPPDFALLDIRMPGMDGLEAAAALWNEMGIPSAVITAFADSSYVEQAQATGVFGYLLKPPTADALRVTLSIAWARACASRELSVRVGQLQTLLDNRKTIEQAKWRLVETRSMTEPQAHQWLQTEARNRRRKLIEIAAEICAQPPASGGDDV